METIFSLLTYMVHIIMIFMGYTIVYNIFIGLMKNVPKEKTKIFLYNQSTKQKIPIKYWENSIGRSGYSDIILQDPTVSRNHGVIFRREDGWFISDTESKTGIRVNNQKIKQRTKLNIGDIIQIGYSKLSLQKVTQEDKEDSKVEKNKIQKYSSISSEGTLLLITFFTLLMSLEVLIFEKDVSLQAFLPIILLNLISWIFFVVNKYIFKRINFELENLGVFLTSISVIIAMSVNVRNAYIQVISLTLGMIFFNILLHVLKDPDKSMKFRLYIAICAILILLLNMVFGRVKHGSQNWIMVGNISVQPSEIVKVMFIIFGTATLEKLQTTKNLTEFIIFTGICIGFLCLMGDFGTALIFFVTFIIVAFMRSGSLRTVLSITFSAFLGATIVLKFKPYIAKRFSVWRHVWEHMNDLGYQQTRVLIYAASGGLLGVGIGRGYLRYVFAATNDLVYGMLCEEFGLFFAILIVMCFVLLAVHSRQTGIKSRSTFYTIMANAASGMLLFQTALNVFGSTDILPLTGVNLPFVSMGGTSIISSWGLLALIKSADERTYAGRRN